MPDFRFLSSASVLASHYSASVSSFPLSSRFRLTVASPVRPFRSRFSGLSPFFPARFPMPSFPVLRTRLPVRFLSPFPDSLPQLFLRCLPRALAFGLSPSDPLSFVRFSSGSGYSASVSSFPISSRLCLTVASPAYPSALASLVFPVLSDLISHVFFPGSSYSASCSFPFALP